MMRPLILLFVCSLLPARTYTTTFPLTENPISESGNWVGGSTAGNGCGQQCWSDVRTTTNKAFGLTGGTFFGDPTALLATGTWGATQTAQGTVRVLTQPSGEIELRLRQTISTSSISGYEGYCSAATGSPYCHIARWNGANGSYCNIEDSTPSIVVVNGDVMKFTVSGTGTVTLTLYVNGTVQATATDTGQNCSPGGAGGPFASGAPGIGMFGGTDTTYTNWGFSQFTASDGPTASLSASSIAFGSQTVGVTSASQSITVTNIGVSTLTVSSVTIGGTNAGDFSFTGTNNCVSASPIAVNGTCTVTVDFTPGATGARAGNVSIASNDSGSPAMFTLSGTGTAAPNTGGSVLGGSAKVSGGAVLH